MISDPRAEFVAQLIETTVRFVVEPEVDPHATIERHIFNVKLCGLSAEGRYGLETICHYVSQLLKFQRFNRQNADRLGNYRECLFAHQELVNDCLVGAHARSLVASIRETGTESPVQIFAWMGMRSIRKQWFGEQAMWICGHATASYLHDQMGMNTSLAGLNALPPRHDFIARGASKR